MPHYDYACSECGHRFETFQNMSDDVLKICPECGKSALRRLIGTGAGLIFKGSGFYITDYKNKTGGSASSSTKSGEGSGSTSGESKASDSAPAKTEGKPASESKPKD